MKVITFYSYKGGQGRTMALASMASLLYRLGKNVVILDLDFEAPGVLAKFGRSALTDPELRGKGVIEYFSKFKKERKVPENIEPFSIKIAPGGIEGAPVQLRLIPTGYAGDRVNYWEILCSSGWSSLFYPRSEDNTRFFKKMKDAICRMEPTPDYLLVDARAGISEFGLIGMIMWANTIICLFSNDPESYEGMRRVLKGLNDNISIMRGKLQIEGSPIILPVLSRIPHFLTDAQKLELQETFPNKLGVEKIFMLHSDFDLQTESFLPISPEGEIKNVQLVHDYLNLFATACPEVADRPDIETKVTYLWNALGFPGKPETIDETYRVFRLRNSQGIMVNLSDNQRNVSFKVETFCAILNDIHRGLVKTTHESLTEVEQSFYHAGSLAGGNFGQSLMQGIWPDPNNMTVKNKLDAWCHFDSGVGFGFMESKELGENNVSGEIVVKDNFLAHNRNRDEADLCSLLSGYITGVLGKILDFEVDVVHGQSLCMRFADDRESCVFRFSRKNIREKTGVE